MDPQPPRRRPRSRPAPPPPEPAAQAPAPQPPEGDGDAGRPPRDPLRNVVAIGVAMVGGVLAIAFATGTEDDLPWGAIAGVLVIVVVAAVMSRRRAQRLRDAFRDDEP